MTGTVGIYLGHDCPPNMVRYLSGLAKVASNDVTFELVGRNLPQDELPDRFEYHRVPESTLGRGIDRIRVAYRDVRAYLSATQPDGVWQITAPHFHAIPTVIAAKRAGVPVATRIPGRKFEEYRKASDRIDALRLYVLNNLQLRLTRFSDHVVTLSDDNVDWLASIGVPRDGIWHLRQPLDTDVFAPPSERERRRVRDRLRIDDAERAVLFVGRLSELKGMKTILAVADQLPPDSPVVFHMVGTGEYQSRLSTLPNVRTHGFVPPEDVHEYYKAADLYVHPSRTEVGGISWTMVEAAATGLPVAARDVGDADDIASVVFDEADALASYLTHPEQWTPARYPTEWSLETLTPEYETFLDALVE